MALSPTNNTHDIGERGREEGNDDNGAQSKDFETLVLEAKIADKLRKRAWHRLVPRLAGQCSLRVKAQERQRVEHGRGEAKPVLGFADPPWLQMRQA